MGIGSFANDTGDATTQYGVAGDPIGGGLGPYPLTYPANFTDFGDIVNAGSGASVAFRSSATGGNNLDVDKDGGDWQTVFFGTSWVPIYNASAANGEQVLQRIVDSFGGCVCEPVHQLQFSWTPLEPDAGETVHLAATAEGELPIAFDWDLGDGTLAGGAQIDHVYASTGTYTVALTATNACGPETISHSLTVELAECEKVEIVTTTTEISGCVVTFGAELRGTPPFAYNWELYPFGSSTSPTVTVDFGRSGDYGYMLGVSNCGGGNHEAVTGMVTVTCEAPRQHLYLPLIVRGE
jgi:PKD repeat protein